MKLLGQDDWLFFARRDDGTLVCTVTETDWHWLEAPHGSDCWNPVTGLNCDGETRFTCRRDCSWMRDHVAAHLDSYDWSECGYDTDGTYFGWPPEKDAEFETASRDRYLPRNNDHDENRPQRAAKGHRTMASSPGQDAEKRAADRDRSKEAKDALNTKIAQWQQDRTAQEAGKDGGGC